MLLRIAQPEARDTDAEDGYLLLTVLVMVFLVLLALSIAAPRMAREIQRDKEQEAMERGLQYQRAIQLYYKKFGAYPSDIKQLENTNEIRYLRKRYKDPITGKDDWRLIHMGEAKVLPLGFFGEPLQTGLSGTPGLYAQSALTGDGTGANGTNGAAGSATSGNSTNSGNNGGSSFGFSNGGSSGSSSGFGSSGIGSSGSSGFGSSGFGSGNGSSSGFNSGNGSSSGFSSGNGSGTSPGGFGQPTGTNGPGASSSSSSAFGAAPIVGVGIPLKKPSMLEYHKQKKYSDWEFVYDPQVDQMMSGGGGILNGGNVNGPGSNGTGPNSGTSGGNGGSTGFGFNNGNSGTSTGSGFGNFGNSGSSGGGGFGNSGNSGTNSGSGSNPPTSSPQPQ